MWRGSDFSSVSIRGSALLADFPWRPVDALWEIAQVSGLISMREATLVDLDDIIDLHTQARMAYYGAGGLPPEAIVNPALVQEQEAGWTAAIESPHKRILCAVDEGRIAGIAAMGPPLSAKVDASTTGQLYQIHVNPARWGEGIGSTLHAAFVRYLDEASLPIGMLEVWERNKRAQSFYARHGWRPDGGFRAGPDDSNYVSMRLDLVADRAPREYTAT
ncbi:GNAT family N-acetyltransferase [Micromonospora sp. WMMD961]|uniref:GNAT family N-acetyltransferase n=1 Tax=Micromonospora sp. WMMD961 TaxID=3016100 RepID=UPI002416D61E|nr:GNAT family N-acetyltransferase [Micromonospora sp. WMMD961]MDG4778733.1 GNAT family N-acetyltransferase [Micromonospora sp. WMMD961]